ncbi:MAG: fused MFS/spermidine synthase [bacterium]
MLQPLKYNVLPISVFITGACVLIIEIVATRVLSPFYGNTIFTVSSVISVILAALSIGYYIGGRLADRKPSFFWFFGIILASGITLLAFHLIGIFVLPALSSFLSLSEGPLISSLLLFFFPAFLLGTLSPYAIKLQSVNYPEQGIGSVAGKIFFWSTLGSIAGSLLAGFVLIPHFGVSEVIIATGVVLFFLGFFGLFFSGGKKYLFKYLFKSLLVFIALFSASLYGSYATKGDALYSKDGVYEKITIYDGWFDPSPLVKGEGFEGRPARFFQQDLSPSGAMFLDSDDPKDLAYEYTKYYSLYKIFNPEIKNALIIGGGAYSIPKAILEDLPEANVDVSEIEPSLFNLAKEYFLLKDTPRFKNYTEDGRRLLNNSDKSYDLIFSDVYYSLYSIPAHFTTQEFFKIAKDRLNQEGIFVANMIGDLSRQQPSLIMSEIKTFESVFENSYFFAVKSPATTSSQNIIFVGYNSKKLIDFSAPEIILNADPVISSLPDKAINIERFDLSPYPMLTDNYSPVEYLTGRVLKKNLEQNPSPLVKGEGFNGQEMLSIIDQQLRYGPRYLTASGHKKVQDFIIAEMKTLADEVKTQIWAHSELNGESYELKNIIASFYPDKTQRIILATHYDSQKISFRNFSNQNQPSPGANNSASGVAVLLETARLLKNSDAPLGIGIDIIFFDGEEGEESQGGDFTNWKPLGSTYFTEHLNEIYKNNKPISGVVLDMVCDKNLKIFKEPSSARDAPAQTEAFWNIASKINGSVFLNEESQEIKDDHTSLNQVGIPSFLVIDYDYPPYATTNDTIDKCSAKSLETVLEALWSYIYQQAE